MTQMAVYPSQTSIASSLISSSHNNHGNYVNRYPNQSKKIGPWRFGKELGTGSTSKVILGTHENTGQNAAIKIVNKSHLDPQELSPNDIDSAGLPYGIQREIIIMKLLNNKNVLKLYDVYESKNHLYLITEYVSNGELFDYLVNVGPLPESQAVAVFHELINGVFFLHNWGIIHRDLKLENILIDDEMHLKIADFGMATLELLKYSQNTNTSTLSKVSAGAATGANTTNTTNTNKIPAFLLETSCGSPHYAAPEVICAEPYNGLKSDIWSCGVIFYALLTGKLPFDDGNIKDLLLKVKSGVYDLPHNLSPESKKLIMGMLCLDVDRRLDADGILKSDLFRKYNIGFHSTNNSQHAYYTNINVFTNSINQNLIKTNKQSHLIINNYNFNKKIQSNPANISARILHHLKILYHNKKSTQDIVENLVNNKVNIDKVFYSLLVSFDYEASNYLTNSQIVSREVNPELDEDYDNSDLEESFPAQLNMDHQRMTKAYSNVSIIASSAHKRNVSFSHNKKKLIKSNRSNHSLYRSGSIYRYSKSHGMASAHQMKSSRSIASHSKGHQQMASMRSNKSISSYYNPHNHLMRVSNSIASYNGSLNLSSYLINGDASNVRKQQFFENEYEDEEEEEEEDEDEEDDEIEFDDDEAINVVSPGVPVFKIAKQNQIQQLTNSYEKLQLEDKEKIPKKTELQLKKASAKQQQQQQQKQQQQQQQQQQAAVQYNITPISRDNFDFEVTDENIKDIHRILANERKKQQVLEKQIEDTLNYSVNYKVSPKRNKRYKTSSLIRNGDNTYIIENHHRSPSKSRSKSKSKSKSKLPKEQSRHERNASSYSIKSGMKNSASRRTVKSTLSSKVIANYARVNNSKITSNLATKYLDSLTTETKSEFATLCDQFFSRSDEKYQSMFGESYIERKAREERESRERQRAEQKAKLKAEALKRQQEKIDGYNKKAAAAAAIAAKNGGLTAEDIKKLANHQSLDKNGFLNRTPVSRLDPGLMGSAIKEEVSNSKSEKPQNSRRSRRNNSSNKATPLSIQDSKNSDSSKESLIFTPSNDIFDPSGVSLDSKSSFRNFSAGTAEVDYFDSYFKKPSAQNEGSLINDTSAGGLMNVAKIQKGRNARPMSSGSGKRASRLQEIFFDDAGAYSRNSYLEDNTEDLENDFEFVTPTSNKFPIHEEEEEEQEEDKEEQEIRPRSRSGIENDSLLYNNNIGDSTRDLVRRTLNAEHNYKDLYKHSVPQLTNPTESPFMQKTSTNRLTQRIYSDENQLPSNLDEFDNDDIDDKELESAQIVKASHVKRKHVSVGPAGLANAGAGAAAVKVFVDMSHSNDSSCNLITNGVPGSSRNLALMAKNGTLEPVIATEEARAAAPNANAAVPNANAAVKPSRNSSLFRRLSFASRHKKSAPVKQPALSTISEVNNRADAVIVDRATANSSAATSRNTSGATAATATTAHTSPASVKAADAKPTAKTTTTDSSKKQRSSSYETNVNKNKELILTLSRTESLVAIKSLLLNWKKYGIRDVKLKDNVISGGIKNGGSSGGKVFLKKIASSTTFKIFVYEFQSNGGAKLEFQKVKGSNVIFEKFLNEVEKALQKENVLY